MLALYVVMTGPLCGSSIQIGLIMKDVTCPWHNLLLPKLLVCKFTEMLKTSWGTSGSDSKQTHVITC